MNYDYYERTFGTNAVCTSKTKGKEFTPMYNYNPKEEFEKTYSDNSDKTFVPMRWPHYYELFGAPSRNRT